MGGVMQMMWPAHCVQDSKGAELHPDLKTAESDVIIYKGTRQEVDSYSAFYDNAAECSTGMTKLLRDKGITDVYCVGLAYDFCVGWSCLDAKRDGFNTTLVEDGTR